MAHGLRSIVESCPSDLVKPSRGDARGADHSIEPLRHQQRCLAGTRIVHAKQYATRQMATMKVENL